MTLTLKIMDYDFYLKNYRYYYKMNRIVISAVSAIAGGVIVHQTEKIRNFINSTYIQELETEVERLTNLVEKLKYDNDKKDKLLNKNFLKISFDTLKDNLNKEKLELTEQKTNDNDYLFNSSSSEEFDQINEPLSSVSDSGANSDAESSNTEDLTSTLI